MSSEPTFQDASERLELHVNSVAYIARGCPLGDAFALLSVIQLDEERYGSLLDHSLDMLAAISEGPIEWEHGRGLSGFVVAPAAVFPHVWLSAHEAALVLSRLALRCFFRPLEVGTLTEFQELTGEQRATFRKALSASRRKALAMTIQEVAQWRAKIRRERLKLELAAPSAFDAAETLRDETRPIQVQTNQQQANELLNELLDQLTDNQMKLLKFLWSQPHGVDWDSLPDDAFRGEGKRSDHAVKRALERLQKRLSELYERFQVSLEIKPTVRRVKLDKASRTGSDTSTDK